MWQHPFDVLKATQRGEVLHILAMMTSHRDEPHSHPEHLTSFMRDYPLDGIFERWWVPAMPVVPKRSEEVDRPRVASMVVVPMPQPKPAPPQPRAREVEVERPPKKQRSWRDVVNSQLKQQQ